MHLLLLYVLLAFFVKRQFVFVSFASLFSLNLTAIVADVSVCVFLSCVFGCCGWFVGCLLVCLLLVCLFVCYSFVWLLFAC